MLLKQTKKFNEVKEKVLPFCLAINTAKSDLMGLVKIKKECRILVGKTRVRGHGVGLNRKLGEAIFTDELSAIKREIGALETYNLDAFFIVAGLGGGTGSGGAPVLAEKLKDVYDEPVYVVGALPTETEGNLLAFNAAKSIAELREMVDGLILFDNDLWRTEGTPITQSYDAMNYELVKPLPFLLQAGETVGKKVGAKVIDASDVIMTLRDFSVMGWSEVKIPRRFPLRRKMTSIDRLSQATKCEMAVVNASTRLAVECDVKSAESVLSLWVGPRKELNREGIERGRSWVKKAMPNAEMRAGDLLISKPRILSKKMLGILLLSGFKDIPKVKKLAKVAENFEPPRRSARWPPPR